MRGSLSSSFRNYSRFLLCLALSASWMSQRAYAQSGSVTGVPAGASQASASAPRLPSVSPVHGNAIPVLPGPIQPIQPVSDVGAAVYLFSFQPTPNGEVPVSLLTDDGSGVVQQDAYGNGYILTDTSGNFNVTGLYAAECPTPTAPIYLLALGGDIGYGVNPSFAEMTAFPVACSQLPNAGSIFINELTTIAAAYVFSPFPFSSADDEFSAPNTSEAALNYLFAYANDYVSGITGTVNSTTSDGGTVPVANINTLADILATCTQNSDPDPCTTLFSAVSGSSGNRPTPYGITYGPPQLGVPSDTFMAAVQIALTPTYNVSGIYSLLDATPFQPVLPGVPADWTLPIAYGTNGTISMSSSANPVAYCQPATLAANVSLVNPPPAFNGVVEFYDNYNNTLLGAALTTGSSNNQSVSIVSSNLSVGTHQITAYLVAPANTTSTPLGQIVTQSTPSVSEQAGPNPSPAGSPVTLTALVACTNVNTTALPPTGTVMFDDGAALLRSALLGSNSTAAVSVSNLSAGAHTLTAQYAGDSNYLSVTSAPIAENISGVPTVTSLTALPNPALFGQPVTLHATLVGSIPTGTLGCVLAGQPVGSITTLDSSGNASISILSLPVGQDTVTCAYSGDSNNQASFASATITISPQNVKPLNGQGPVGSNLNYPNFGDIITIAGNGSNGYSGDGGMATSAAMYHPRGIVVAPNGDVYFSDGSGSNNSSGMVGARVRKIAASTGIVTTVAGDGTSQYSGYTGAGGPAVNAEIQWPIGLALDAAGNLYIASGGPNCVLKVTAAGIISTFAGVCMQYTSDSQGYSGDGGAATNAHMWLPSDMAFDGSGNLFITEYNGCRVRKVATLTGIISTMAGTGVCGYNGDNQPATSAQLYAPASIAFDGYGNMYISEFSNRIRMVAAGTNTITTVVGTGADGYSGDGGLATNAEISYGTAMTVDQVGNIYIADFGNNRIREVTGSTIRTIGGTGTPGFTGDGGEATSAEVNGPSEIALDSTGNIYVGDSYNSRMRVIGGSLSPSTFNPAYKVMSILYSPPGNQSTQGYSTATTDGTTTSIGSSFTSGVAGNYMVSLNQYFSFGGTIGNSSTAGNMTAFTQSFTDTTTITTGDNSSTAFNPTASNAINHNLDTFEIWLNPLVTIQANGTTPVSYTVDVQPVTVNGVPSPIIDIVGVPAIAMETAQPGVTALNPTGNAGVSTIPVALLAPIAISQGNGVNTYMPGLAAVCKNLTLYSEQLAADLVNAANPTIVCTQSNQCGCTPADFSDILATNPLLNYSSTTYTANPYPGTESPLDADSLATTSGPGSGGTVCGVNAPPATANCRYVAVPYPGTNTPGTGNANAVPATYPLAGAQYPTFSITDANATAETLSGSSTSSVSLLGSVGALVGKLGATGTWSWTDSQSMGNIYTTANTMSVTLKTSSVACSEEVSVYEDTLYHTFVFQVPTGIQNCN